MYRAQMDKQRERFTKSKNKQNKVFGPWADHYVSMGLKTVILKLIKYMPISIEQQESQKILEGLQRDNGVSTVKESEVGFGDAYINTEYSMLDIIEVV